jgi:hypothetical protein
MKFVSAATALLVSSLVKQTSAFSPVVRRNVPVVASVASHRQQPQRQRQRAFVSATGPRYMANVLKLTEPQTQLLDEVDVFIFDCDGVIWRVRFLL